MNGVHLLLNLLMEIRRLLIVDHVRMNVVFNDDQTKQIVIGH